MREMYLAQEHNAVPQPELEPGPLDPESAHLPLGHRASRIFVLGWNKRRGVNKTNGDKIYLPVT